MIYYTADLHLGHANVIRFDSRPFGSVEEMDRALTDNWNRRVTEQDDVYILGDLCFRGEKPPAWYLRQLRGRKHLIVGNHDGAVLSSAEALACFESVDKMRHIVDGRNHICACHFPLADWNGAYKGHYHVYGHIHNRKDRVYQYMRGLERALNAGCMLNGYEPVTLEELIANNRAFQMEDT